jgi:hypothetical protein
MGSHNLDVKTEQKLGSGSITRASWKCFVCAVDNVQGLEISSRDGWRRRQMVPPALERERLRKVKK